MIAVRRMAAADIPAATAIVRGLPEYFTSDVPGQVERDAASHDAWVLTQAGVVARWRGDRPGEPGDVGGGRGMWAGSPQMRGGSGESGHG